MVWTPAWISGASLFTIAYKKLRSRGQLLCVPPSLFNARGSLRERAILLVTNNEKSSTILSCPIFISIP
ncbi:rieske [Moniliophthora roreri]|nr:rieske [Moniliophthora roreri]